jgi:hypothetical protein
MKLIHTFVPNKFDLKNEKDKTIIWKDLMYVQMLSVLLANREYGGISLYTNNTIKKQILDIGVPYSEIDTDILQDTTSDLFCIPKLRIYREIKEPFVHIDTDTLIYNKIDFSKFDSSVVYSHPDIRPPLHKNGDDKLREIFNNYPSLVDSDSFFKSAKITYLDLFNRLNNDHSEFKLNNIRVGDIPNMNIIIVNDHDNFNKASQMSLDHYIRNKEIIDSTKNGECYIEQLMIHLNMMEISEKYREEVIAKKTFILKDSPFMLDADFGSHLDDLKFPFTMIHNSHKDVEIDETIHINGVLYSRTPEYHEHYGRTTKVNSMEDIIKLFDFDFYGLSHLTFYKWSEFFQAIVIGYIVKNFGEEYVRSVYEYYKTIYPVVYSFPRLSKGETLYQDLTGFKFEKIKSLV